MIRAALLALALALVWTAPAARAADEGRVLRQQAERLASEDRCDEALPRARRARALDPDDARAALVEGRCLMRAGDYEAALAPLREARALDPALPGVSTDLVQALYHLDRIPEAREELDRAEAENPDDARLALYKGLVLLRDAEDAEAAASFDRAASLDPRLSDTASLYAGRTWASLDERERAEQALERARDADPDSDWGRAAARELDQLQERTRPRSWVRVKGGLEYDSNVPLLADISVSPFIEEELGPFDEPEDDMRGIFEVETGLELLRTSDWSGGVRAGYDGNAHAEINTDIDTGDFDLQAPWAAFWLDRRLSEETWLRLQPYGGFTWLGGDPFVLYGGLDGEVSTRFGERWGGRVLTNVAVYDFQFRGAPVEPPLNPPDPALENQVRRDRNRDGVIASAGLEGTHDLAVFDTYLRLGSAYEGYWAEGRDWSYDGSRTWIGLVQPLPLRLRLEVLGRFSYLVYDHASSFHRNYFTPGGTPRRRDVVWQAETELSHRLTPWLEIAAHYRYDNQDSNTRVFDYDRHVAGGTFTVFFGHY